MAHIFSAAHVSLGGFNTRSYQACSTDGCYRKGYRDFLVSTQSSGISIAKAFIALAAMTDGEDIEVLWEITNNTKPDQLAQVLHQNGIVASQDIFRYQEDGVLLDIAATEVAVADAAEAFANIPSHKQSRVLAKLLRAFNEQNEALLHIRNVLTSHEDDPEDQDTPDEDYLQEEEEEHDSGIGQYAPWLRLKTYCGRLYVGLWTQSYSARGDALTQMILRALNVVVPISYKYEVEADSWVAWKCADCDPEGGIAR